MEEIFQTNQTRKKNFPSRSFCSRENCRVEWRKERKKYTAMAFNHESNKHPHIYISDFIVTSTLFVYSTMVFDFRMTSNERKFLPQTKKKRWLTHIHSLIPVLIFQNRFQYEILHASSFGHRQIKSLLSKIPSISTSFFLRLQQFVKATVSALSGEGFTDAGVIDGVVPRKHGGEFSARLEFDRIQALVSKRSVWRRRLIEIRTPNDGMFCRERPLEKFWMMLY